MEGKAKKDLSKVCLEKDVDDVNRELLELLVSTGVVDVNEAVDRKGHTALHICCRRKNLSGVKDLLAKGADPNIAKNNGETCLFEAVVRGHRDIVEVLLQHKADPNLCSLTGHSPLFAAAAAGSNDLVRTLVRAGACLHHLSDQGHSVVHLAAIKYHEETVELLQKLEALVVGDDVCQVAEVGDLRALELLKPYIDMRDEFLSTPLHYAVLYDQEEAVRFLLENGCDVNVLTQDMQTPLSLTRLTGNKVISDLLVSYGGK